MYPTNQQITCRLHDLPLSVQSERSERVQQTQVVVRAKRAQLLVYMMATPVGGLTEGNFDLAKYVVLWKRTHHRFKAALGIFMVAM